jgi:hypothetical protein
MATNTSTLVTTEAPVATTEDAVVAAEAPVVAAEAPVDAAKKKRVIVGTVRRGVKRPLRRLPEDVLRTRRAEFKRREMAHVAAAERAGALVRNYDAEFVHRGLTVEEEAAA